MTFDPEHAEKRLILFIEKKEAAQALADELFGLVEFVQGKAFISDGCGSMSQADIFEMARTSLMYTEETAKKLRRWLKKYGQRADRRI